MVFGRGLRPDLLGLNSRPFATPHPHLPPRGLGPVPYLDWTIEGRATSPSACQGVQSSFP